MAAYQLTPDPAIVIRESDGAHVPVGQPTADSVAYAVWLAAGYPPDVVPAPTPAQQYGAAVAAGCEIVSTGTPALDGTYALDAGSISDIQAEQAFIAAYTEFSTATPTMAWPVVGGAVTFPTTTAALAVFKALAQYVTGWKQFAASISTAAPSQPVTIT